MIHRAAFLLVVLAGFMLSVVPSARAGIPSAGNSTVPAIIRLVGSSAGTPDSIAGKFAVTVNDIANNPRAGSFVTVDFSACSDIRIASNQLNPNLTVNCSQHTVSAYTNNSGVAAFTVLGNSWNAGVYSGAGCARIFADGVLLSSPNIATYDLDGAAGVSIGDLSVWLGDYAATTSGYRARSDFDGNHAVSIGDLSLWLGVLGRQHSIATGADCP